MTTAPENPEERRPDLLAELATAAGEDRNATLRRENEQLRRENEVIKQGRTKKKVASTVNERPSESGRLVEVGAASYSWESA